MPRIARGLGGAGVAHVLNRSNGRGTIFHTANDYADFIRLLSRARQRNDVDLLAFCIMPNHFHLVVQVDSVGQLSSMMQWWLTSHVRRYHQRHGSSGHIWQGRFKSFPVQEDNHLLTVLRYVLMNPCKANLVERADAWRWSSLHYPSMLTQWPIEPPLTVEGWLQTAGSTESEMAVQRAIHRSAPLGDAAWQIETAAKWGLESTLLSLGRPRSLDRAA